MRPEERDAGYLLDMLQHARGVARAPSSRTLEEYAEDEDLRLLVERRLEIMGEAARRVSEPFQAAHPEPGSTGCASPACAGTPAPRATTSAWTASCSRRSASGHSIFSVETNRSATGLKTS